MSVSTSPATWNAGEIPTAAKMNTEIRDFAAGVQAAWDAYTPAWTASTTNPALGNGTAFGAYIQTGKTIRFRARITLGSTSTVGSGSYKISLPVAVAGAEGARFAVAFFDASSSSSYSGTTYSVSGSTAFVATPGTNGLLAGVTPTSPFTWAAGDYIEISGTYEAA